MSAPALAAVSPFAPSSTPSDEGVPAYVRRAQSGDAAAFRELYLRHKREVARLVLRMVGPRSDLDDVVQDVFIQVFRSLSAFRGDARFSTWLHRVTVNVTLMYLRAQKSRPQLSRDSSPPDAPAAESDSPAATAATAERLRALYAILDRLSEKKRVVFVLHDLEGVPAAEIARLVSAPVLTVRTRLFYARREVYAAMAQDKALDAVARELGLGPDGAGG
jgi:RNA polymerase sigma-70 factor (ECF subfamily)